MPRNKRRGLNSKEKTPLVGNATREHVNAANLRCSNEASLRKKAQQRDPYVLWQSQGINGSTKCGRQFSYFPGKRLPRTHVELDKVLLVAHDLEG